MFADAKRILVKESEQGYRIACFVKNFDGPGSPGKYSRRTRLNREIFAYFDGKSWLFQGCQLVFATNDECQAYIDEHLDTLLTELRPFLEKHA